MVKIKEIPVSWNEKYRPITLDEIIISTQLKQEIEVYQKISKPINILLVGPPGCGKTSLARIIGFNYLSNFDNNLVGDLHEYNASDDRGIDFIRGDIKNIIAVEGIDVILLDEGDYLTNKKTEGGAQPALRRIAENGNKKGKIMIITCNNISNIIGAIKSRFKIIVMNRPTDKDIAKKIKQILDAEGVNYDLDIQKKFIGQVIINANGDMRQAINNIEWAVIDNELVVNEGYLLYRESVDTYRNILSKIFDKGDFMSVNKDIVYLMYEQKYVMLPAQIIRVTNNWVENRILLNDIELKEKKLNKITEYQYLRLLQSIRETDKWLSQDVTPDIQILGMLADFRHISLS